MGNRILSMNTVAAAMALLMLGCQGGGDTASSQSEASGQARASADVSKDNPCTLLTVQQVEEAVGMKPTLREVVDEVTCSYEFDAPAAEAKPPDAGEPAAKSDEEEAEAMAKAFTVGATGGTPKFTFTIHWEDGETVMMGTRMANQMMSAGAESAFTKLEGVGDEAWMGPLGSTAIVLKGDVAVELDLRLLPEGKERGTRLVKAIAGRL